MVSVVFTPPLIRGLDASSIVFRGAESGVLERGEAVGEVKPYRKFIFTSCLYHVFRSLSLVIIFFFVRLMKTVSLSTVCLP